MSTTAPIAHALRPSVLGGLLVSAMMLAACSASPNSSPTAAAASVEAASPSYPAALSPLPTAAASGFAFSADGILGYYQSIGYTCGEPRPSTTAVGYVYRSCQSQDASGRDLVVGLVTDPDGALADALASVQGTAGETVLAPSDALDPLSAFLGATLGEQRGSALLMWLAGNLGNDYAQTTSVDLTVATYTASATDHSRLYVEIANQSYLDAPTPSSP